MINLHRAHCRCLIAPLAANVIEHICDLLVVQCEQVRWHAEWARASLCAGAIATIQCHLYEVFGLRQDHSGVARERRVCMGFAFAVFAVARGAVCLVQRLCSRRRGGHVQTAGRAAGCVGFAFGFQIARNRQSVCLGQVLPRVLHKFSHGAACVG